MKIGWLVTVALGAAVSWLGQVPQGAAPDYGVLRLSWKTVGEKLRVARAQQDQNVPEHMRLPGDSQAFTETIRPYRLQLHVDGRSYLDRVIRGAGFRHDRPLSVFEEVRLSPGPHAVRVAFVPEPAEGATWKPMWEGTVEVGAGEVRLFRLDSEKGFLLSSRTP